MDMGNRIAQASSVIGGALAATDGQEPVPSIEHLRKLQSVTDAALAYLTVERLLDELLIRVRDALSTDTAAILLLDRARAELVSRAAKGIEEEVTQGVRIPLGKGFAGTIAATGRPAAIFDVDHSNVLNPILREKGIRSLLGVPLVVQGETLGVLHVGTLVPRRFGAEDTALLQLVGDRVALAIHAGLYKRERTVARTLQRSLLPERLPSPPGIRLAARYLPAPGGEVGGDWYDAFVLPSGSVAVAIGDVVGRGLGAASAMAKLRNALRAYSVELASPSDVLDRMDRLLQHLDPGEMATALYGVIDPARLTFRFACAGHIPPVLRDPDGSVRVARVDAGPPLGAGVGGTFTEYTEQLRPGSTVVLCTDGLVERRDASLDEGLQRLCSACTEDSGPEVKCDRIIGRLTVDRGAEDDVALLVVEVAPDQGDAWQTSLPADAKQLILLRRALKRWLTQRGVEPNLAYDVVAASSEAAANAIEHAYGPSGGAIRVAAERATDAIVVTVRDFGRWRPPRVAHRGRGIHMMNGLTDSVQISRSDAGTSVQLRWCLTDD
jgi:anti-sigma regulatory factor (Ser/Thr protein kinase)/putative methionine-R-sulfoxide reductase with GAF domain